MIGRPERVYGFCHFPRAHSSKVLLSNTSVAFVRHAVRSNTVRSAGIMYRRLMRNTR